MAKIHVVAAAGRLVRDPVTRRPIPAEGIDVEESDIYWFRRIEAGDVVKGTAKTAAPAKAKE